MFKDYENKPDANCSPPFKIAGAFGQPKNGKNAGDADKAFQNKANGFFSTNVSK